jgi:hypothetical protein
VKPYPDEGDGKKKGNGKKRAKAAQQKGSGAE